MRKLAEAILALFFCFLMTAELKAQTVVYSNDFSGGDTGWSLGQGNNFDTWVVNNVYNCASTTPDQGGGNYLHIYDDLFGDYCAHSLFAGFGSAGTVYATMTTGFSTLSLPDLDISFDWLCVGQTGPLLSSFGFVEYSTNGGTSWTRFTSPMSQYNGQSSWTSVTISSSQVPGILNQGDLRLRFGFENSGYGLNPAFAVDNISISSSTPPPCTNTGGDAAVLVDPICEGDSTSVMLTGQDGIIQWEFSIDGGSTWNDVVDGTGINDTVLNTAGLDTTTWFRAKLSQNGCPDEYSTIDSVHVDTNALVGIDIFHFPDKICETGLFPTFGANVQNGGALATVRWFKNDSMVGFGTVLFGVPIVTGDTIYAELNSTAVCALNNPDTSLPIIISTVPNPVPVLNVQGSLEFCDGDSVTLSAGSFSHYLWSNGDSSSSISIHQSGTFHVMVTDSNECEGQTNDTTVLVHPNPIPPAALLGPSSFCEGDSVEISTGNYSSYLWSNGGTDQAIIVESSGTFNVSVVDVNGCEGISNDTSVVVFPLPTASLQSFEPLCLEDAPMLLSGGDPANGTYSGQGVSNGKFDPGTAGIGIHSIQYTYTDSNGCTDTALSTIEVEACTGVFEKKENEETLFIYPNPGEGQFTLLLPHHLSAFDLSIINVSGQEVFYENIDNAGKTSTTIQLDVLLSGLYWLKLWTEEETYIRKLIIVD